MYRIQQFADLAGVTVRTLRHYDRIGLLRPSLRTYGGYRLYGAAELVALERIVVLRYLGMTLREIAEFQSGRAPLSLAETLAAQTRVLRERRDSLSCVLRAVEHAQRQLQAGGTEGPLLQSLLKEITMQENRNWASQYYTPKAQAALDNGPQWTPELQARVSADWSELFRDVESAMARNLDKSSPEAKALAERWMALVAQFTGGNPEVLAGLNRMYADRENWPASRHQESPIKPELMDWIRQVQRS